MGCRLLAVVWHRFEQKGYTLKGLKLINVDRGLAEKHYQVRRSGTVIRPHASA